MWILVALIAIPIIEIALFIELGGAIGLWPTIGLIIFTAVLGAGLMRAQGVTAMSRLQASVEDGGDASGPLAHGAMILVAGVLMLTPGFFTDAVGLLLLIPPLRETLIGWAGPRLAARRASVASGGRGAPPPGGGRGPASGRTQPIEAEYEDLTETDGNEKRRGDSGWTKPPD